jgi:hypothetical protein
MLGPQGGLNHYPSHVTYMWRLPAPLAGSGSLTCKSERTVRERQLASKFFEISVPVLLHAAALTQDRWARPGNS